MSNYFVTNCNRDYQTRNHSKFLLKCHLIFVVKYRKKIIKGKIKDDLKNVLILAQTPEFRIEVMESDIDHIHFLIDYDPVLSIPKENCINHPARPALILISRNSVSPCRKGLAGVAGQQQVGELVKADQDLLRPYLPLHL